MCFLKELNTDDEAFETNIEDEFKKLIKASNLFTPEKLSKDRGVSQFEILKVIVHPYMGKEWTQSEVSLRGRAIVANAKLIFLLLT